MADVTKFPLKDGSTYIRKRINDNGNEYFEYVENKKETNDEYIPIILPGEYNPYTDPDNPHYDEKYATQLKKNYDYYYGPGVYEKMQKRAKEIADRIANEPVDIEFHEDDVANDLDKMINVISDTEWI